MYRKGGYIVARIVGLIAVILMAALVAVQTPYVQNILSRKLVDKLTHGLDAKVSYDEIKVMPSGVLLIRNLLIIDKKPYAEDKFNRGWEPVDTVFKARTIAATFSIKGIFSKQGIHLGRVMVEEGSLHLVDEPAGYSSNIARIFKLKAKSDSSRPEGEVFDIRKVRVRNFRFRNTSFLEDLKYFTGYGINYDDIDVTASATAHSLKLSGGRVYAVCDRLTAREKSGYVINNLKGKCAVGQGKMLVEGIRLEDPWSDIRLNHFSQSYLDPDAYSRYISEILMDGEFERTRLAMKTLSYFIGIMQYNGAVFDIKNGRLNGYVNDFAVKDLIFRDTDSGVSACVNGRCTGLPKINDMIVDVNLKNCHFTTSGLSRLLSGFVPGSKINFSKYAAGKNLSLDATAKGPLNRVKIRGRMGMDKGSVDLNADIRNLIDKARSIELSAEVQTRAMDIGAIAGISKIGECSLYARGKAILHKDLPDLTLDTLRVEKANIYGYSYKDISASGKLADKTASGIIVSSDPNLKLHIAGLADLEPIDGNTRYKVVGEISNADLNLLHLDRRGKSRISMSLYANLVHGTLLHGDAFVNDIRLTNDVGTHNIGDLIFRAFSTGTKQSYRLTSSFAEGSMSGSGSFRDFIEDVQGITARRELPALYPDSLSRKYSGQYDLDLTFHDTRSLLAFIAPGVYIADSTRLNVSVGKSGSLEGRLTSSRLASGTNYLKNVSLLFDNLGKSLNATIVSDEFRAGTFSIYKPAFTAYAKSNELSLSAHFDNESATGGNGDLYLNGEIYRDSCNVLVVKAHPLNSSITTGRDKWTFGESDIVLRGKDFYIDKFSLTNGNQSMLADGGISKDRSDTLILDVNNVDLSLVDQFMPKKYGVKGRLGGKAYLTSEVGKAIGMLMNFNADSLSVGGVDAGSVRLSSELADNGREILLYLRNVIAGRDAIYAKGSYALDNGNIKLSASLDNFPLKEASPFLSDIFSEMGGGISGDISIEGPPDRLSTSSDNLFINNAMIRPTFTGVPYIISGPVRMDNTGLYFDALKVKDNENGTADITGAVRYAFLQDITLDSRINFKDLKVVDAAEHGSGGPYGLLKASGNATVTGPFNSLAVNATVRTSGSGNIHIPLSGNLSASTSDLLKFTESKKKLDPYEEMLITYKARDVRKSNINIHANVTAESGVKAYLEFDKESGNVMSFSGTGNVSVAYRPSEGVLALNGDYKINEGQYQLVVQGVLSKLFEIQNGSTLNFTGDIMDTQLDISAKHELKTSLAPIVSTTSGVATRRLVECGISITDRLKNPKIGFSINIPDLEPTTKSQVESALNTEDKVQKQFVALLLMGSFITNETSGVINGSSVLMSNVTGFMSGQINSIMQKLEIPLDVQLAYQSGTGGTDIFDVALSTQLLNNKIIVGGSVGNRKYKTSSNVNGDVVGNLDMQVKLDQEGKFRLNLFSHSADEYTSFLDYSQRNGVGISYQKEFNSFGDLVHSIFKTGNADENQKYGESGDNKVKIKIEHE